MVIVILLMAYIMNQVNTKQSFISAKFTPKSAEDLIAYIDPESLNKDSKNLSRNAHNSLNRSLNSDEDEQNSDIDIDNDEIECRIEEDNSCPRGQSEVARSPSRGRFSSRNKSKSNRDHSERT